MPKSQLNHIVLDKKGAKKEYIKNIWCQVIYFTTMDSRMEISDQD
jgi:hypothetical protein